MKFESTAAEQEFCARIREGAGHLADGTAPYITRDEWKRCAALGATGLSVPAHYGGGGLGFSSTARVTEALGRGSGDMGLVFGVLAHLFACAMPIAEHGGEQTRQRLLPKLCSGEWIGANAITEAGAGSDVMAMAARARRVGDHYELSGEKTFVSNAPIADVFVVYAVTDPALGHLGISAFAVERGTPGVVVSEPFAKSGLRRCPAGTVTFDRCRVPAADLLGGEGQGGAVFQRSMRWERSCLFAAYVGRAEHLLERCVAHARGRRQFGRPIGQNQAVAHRIARMRIRLESSRLLLHHACTLLDQDAPAVLEVAMANHEIAENAVESALDTQRILGGAGIRQESGAGAELDDAVPALVFSGTSEIQLEQIAREMGI